MVAAAAAAAPPPSRARPSLLRPEPTIRVRDLDAHVASSFERAVAALQAAGADEDARRAAPHPLTARTRCTPAGPDRRARGGADPPAAAGGAPRELRPERGVADRGGRGRLRRRLRPARLRPEAGDRRGGGAGGAVRRDAPACRRRMAAAPTIEAVARRRRSAAYASWPQSAAQHRPRQHPRPGCAATLPMHQEGEAPAGLMALLSGCRRQRRARPRRRERGGGGPRRAETRGSKRGGKKNHARVPTRRRPHSIST